MAYEYTPVSLSIDSLWTTFFGKTENIDWITAREKFHTDLEVPYADLRGLKKFAVQAYKLQKSLVFKIFQPFPKFYGKKPFPNQPIYEDIPSFEWICNLLNHPAFFGLQDYSNPNLKEGEFFVRLSSKHIVAFEFNKDGEIKKIGAVFNKGKLAISREQQGVYLDDLIKAYEELKSLKPPLQEITLDDEEKKLFDKLKEKKTFLENIEKGIETVDDFNKANNKNLYIISPNTNSPSSSPQSGTGSGPIKTSNYANNPHADLKTNIPKTN